MNISDLIQPRHLSRRAVIYVRQSSTNQVIHNPESRRLQYALHDRATQLGWHEQDVAIIDVDLGKTAATTQGRAGFQELVAQVALGQVGILIAYDATRLARNCSHWYQLLDLCGRTDCLIADRDGVYDPTSINGRLLLGLKGQISELDNRLVTDELERRWETALRELKSAEESLDHDHRHAPTYTVPDDLLELLKEIGPRLPELWNAQNKLLRTSQKKSLLRSLIDKVVLHRVAPDLVHVRVVWRGGATTSTDVAVSVGSFSLLSAAKEMEEAIIRLARTGQSDEAIATRLSSQGYRSPQSHVVLDSTVKNIRLSHGILHRPSQSHPRRVPGFLTIPQLSKKLGIARSWIHDRIGNGTIAVKKDPTTRCYLFPDKPGTLDQFRQLHLGQINRLGC